MSQLRKFKISERERQTKSYSKSDYKFFSDVRNYEIAKCSSLVALKFAKGERLTKDDMALCRGLESFISPDIPRRIRKLKKSREMHVEAVLAEQEARQGGQGLSQRAIQRAIARVSEKSSWDARSRSFQVATAACI